MYGHKFDLRVFVTVTSLQPLRVFVHHHGWANVADRPYAADTHLSHVTNAAFVEHVDPAQVPLAAESATDPCFFTRPGCASDAHDAPLYRCHVLHSESVASTPSRTSCPPSDRPMALVQTIVCGRR